VSWEQLESRHECQARSVAGENAKTTPAGTALGWSSETLVKHAAASTCKPQQGLGGRGQADWRAVGGGEGEVKGTGGGRERMGGGKGVEW
jgi:hypothetical protein